MVAGAITVDIVESGLITGTTTDVAPGTNVVLTITGKDANGNPVTVTKTVQTDASGHYNSALTAADGIADGSGVSVVANTTDRNGQAVPPATDSIAAQGDNDNDSSTPEDTGLDLVAGAITVDIVESGLITGTTTDVAPGTNVVLTITGKDANGNPVTVTKTVQTDASGHYNSALTAADGIADGSGVTVVATTTDRNGQAVPPATDSIAAQGDNDNDSSTPEDTGLDLVAGAITVDIVESGLITGTTTDVAPGTNVVLTIIGFDENGEEIEIERTVQTDSSGNYQYQIIPADGIATGTDGSTVWVVANSTDNNRNNVNAQDSEAVDPVIKGDTSTGITNGDNSVTGTSGDDLLTGDIGGLKTNFIAGNNYNISIILDVSGSMGRNLYDESTAVPPALSRLDIAKAGLKAFVEQMLQHDGTIIFRLTTFSGSGNTIGYTEFEVNQSNKATIFAQIDGLVAGGGTYPGDAFTNANTWFTSKQNGYENQTYYLTDGDPNESLASMDTKFQPLAAQSKVFAVGVSNAVNIANVERYDNTDVNGNKISGTWNGVSNHGTAQKFTEADKLIAYLIGGSENFIPADVGADTIKGGAGDDVLFGDAMNTDWITGLDPLQYPQYSGYSKLIAHLKATETGGAEPTQQQIYDFVKANYRDFIAADATDPATKGGNDTIYGGSGDDIIIAGAGNDIIYGGSGNDIISTGRGDDTIMYDVLNAADAKGGNGTDTWVDYEANDKIEFSADFFDGLLADKSNIGDYITIVADGNGNAVIQVDRDGSAATHTMSDLLIVENQAGLSLQDLIDNNQLLIG
nr:VWA domain-containing protein [Acinetobacter sp. SA01]